jgi:hypothetical protein
MGMHRVASKTMRLHPAVVAVKSVFATAIFVLAASLPAGCSAGPCTSNQGGAAEPAAKPERAAEAERSGGVPIAAGEPEKESAGKKGEAPLPLRPEEVIRISPEEARPLVKRGEAVLVCAYDRPEVFEDVRLEGAVSFPKFEEMLPILPKNHLIIFY